MKFDWEYIEIHTCLNWAFVTTYANIVCSPFIFHYEMLTSASLKMVRLVLYIRQNINGNTI